MAVTLLWAAGAKNILIKNHGLLHAQITCCKNYSFPSIIKDNLSYLENHNSPTNLALHTAMKHSPIKKWKLFEKFEQVLRNNMNSSEECFSPNDKIL